jgi:hypothetical protein
MTFSVSKVSADRSIDHPRVALAFDERAHHAATVWSDIAVVSNFANAFGGALLETEWGCMMRRLILVALLPSLAPVLEASRRFEVFGSTIPQRDRVVADRPKRCTVAGLAPPRYLGNRAAQFTTAWIGDEPA